MIKLGQENMDYVEEVRMYRMEKKEGILDKFHKLLIKS